MMYGDDASVEKSDHELDGVSFKEIGFVGGATLSGTFTLDLEPLYAQQFKKVYFSTSLCVRMMSCRLYQSHFNQKIMHEYYGHHDMIYGKSSHHKSWVSFGNAAELAIVCIKNTELYL